MNKSCMSCGKPFANEDQIIAIIGSKYKAIPSRVMYAIEAPSVQDIYDILHHECAIHEMLIPPDDLGILD